MSPSPPHVCVCVCVCPPVASHTDRLCPSVPPSRVARSLAPPPPPLPQILAEANAALSAALTSASPEPQELAAACDLVRLYALTDVAESFREAEGRLVEVLRGRGRVTISGAKGSNARIVNGTFRPTDQVQNGRPVYAHEGHSNAWLYYAVDQAWYVSNTESKDAGKAAGWAQSMELNLLDPTQGQKWSVYDGTKHVEQASVRVVRR